MPVEEGHGYQGVVLWDSVEDKIQCHICGKMLKNVANHIKKHKIKGREYKEKYGLMYKTPLITHGIWEERKKAGYKTWAKLKQFPPSEKGRVTRAKKDNSIQDMNKYGTCPLQIIDRFKKIRQESNKTPTQRQIKEMDSGLYEAIVSRYGSYNRYLEIQGIEKNREWRLNYSCEDIFSLYTKFKSEYGRLPVIMDIERGLFIPIMSKKVIVRLFGSFGQSKLDYEQLNQ